MRGILFSGPGICSPIAARDATTIRHLPGRPSRLWLPISQLLRGLPGPKLLAPSLIRRRRPLHHYRLPHRGRSHAALSIRL